MGIIASNANDYYYSHYLMNTDAEIQYRCDQRDYIEKAKAWGRAEALSQMNATGIAGGGSGFGPNQFGMQMGFWQGINRAMVGLGLLLSFLGLGLSLAAYFLDLSPGILFTGLWLFLTFTSQRMIYNSMFGQRMQIYSTIPVWTVVGGAVVGGVITVLYSFLIHNRDQSKRTRVIVGSVGSGLMLLLLIYFGFGIHAIGSAARSANAGVLPPQAGAAPMMAPGPGAAAGPMRGRAQSV